MDTVSKYQNMSLPDIKISKYDDNVNILLLSYKFISNLN